MWASKKVVVPKRDSLNILQYQQDQISVDMESNYHPPWDTHSVSVQLRFPQKSVITFCKFLRKSLEVGGSKPTGRGTEFEVV